MGNDKQNEDTKSVSAETINNNTEVNNSKTTFNDENSGQSFHSESNISSTTKISTKIKNETLDANQNSNENLSDDAKSTVTKTNNEFRIRIIPLERLLEKPPKPVTVEKSNKKEVKILPNRKSRTNISIVELSSESEESSEEVLVASKKQKTGKENTNKTVNKNKDPRLLIKRCVVRIKRIGLPVSSKNKEPQPHVNGIVRRGISNSSDNTEKDTTKKKHSTERSRKKGKMSDSVEDSDFEVQEETVVEDDDRESKNSNSESDVKSSDSEIIPTRKKRVFKKKNNSSNDDSDFEQEKKSSKKRRRVKKNSSEDSGSGSGSGDDENQKNKRKHIRKIIKTKDLDVSTKEATKEEEERRKRIEERQRLYNKIYEKPESTEVSELVLDFDPDTKDVILEVDKGLLKKLKPHQVTGVKFMWDACFETVKDAAEKPGSGCILAHCMGLGKTLQIVALTHTLITNTHKTSIERVLIISPLSTLNNWAREFVQWMKFARKKNIEIYDMSRFKDKATRIFKLYEWFEEGGVCILGYDMYRILANEKAKGLRKKQREQLQKALVDPGPDLVVCDEGHLLKNEKTSISKAVTKMRTRRRIVLTGTPLQNNLKEYYCMIQFIKPSLLGTYKEYMNRFVNPISNGQYTDSTEKDIRLMKHRSHILHTMLEGCMQRRDYSVLAPYLPPKHEYVVYTILSDLQQQLYEYYMTTHRDIIHSDIGGKGARLFQDFQDLRRIWTHPKNLHVNSETVIAKRLLTNDNSDLEDFICDDEDESEASKSDSSIDSSKSFASAGKPTGHKIRTRNNRNNDDPDNESDVEEVTNKVEEKDDPSEWWKRFVEEKELNNIHHSPKLVILMEILKQCEVIGDKLLVFSQSLQSLDVIEHFLALIDSKTKGYEYEGDVGDFKGFWTAGKDYFRLDGSCSVEQRESMCKKFNDTKNIRARLFLISTRAGGLGINLVAANRVVIFDVSWNPSHDTQSIFRVYRFGQDKPCYIYRLIAMGTMEQKVYERQVLKQATAKRVIDEQQISRHYNQSDLQELYIYELKPTTPREIPILPKDRLFAELLAEHEKILFKYHEHDSLLENEESENLTEAERKAAWSEYEAEKTRTVQTAQFISYDRGAYGVQYGNTSGNVTSNKVFGFRSDVLLKLLNMKVSQDLPGLNENQVTQLVPSYFQRLITEMNNGDPSLYKDLLQLHTTLAHPSGMYMNPLLYANQSPSGGFLPATSGQQPINAPMQAPMPQPTATTSGFEPNQVYEID